MENLDAKAQWLGPLAGWTPCVAANLQTLTAWTYALGCGKVQVVRGMLRLLGSSESRWFSHIETELRHSDWLHEALQHERKQFQKQYASYHLIEGTMTQAVESYVRSFLGYTERQTLCLEAQYCTATLALGSRIFRHFSELGRECGELELSRVLTRIVEEEARFVRTAQSLLQTLPRQTHGLYRSIRAFEEMLFDRTIRKLSRSLEIVPVSCSQQTQRPANPHWLARCV
jgi:hypothetical protein